MIALRYSPGSTFCLSSRDIFRISSYLSLGTTLSPLSNLTTSGPFSPTKANPVLSITPPVANLGIFPNNELIPLGIFTLDFTPSITLSFKGATAANADSRPWSLIHSRPFPLTAPATSFRIPLDSPYIDLVISPTPFLNIPSKDFKNFLF